MQRAFSGAQAAILCAFFCLLFACLSWRAVVHKSPTADEPSHADIARLITWEHEFRASPDVPPLWEEYVALGSRLFPVWLDPAAPSSPSIQMVASARRVSLVLGVALAGLIGLWAWRLGGAAAAVASSLLFCFDPNFIGHSALAKNDVAESLCFLAAAYSLWRLGREVKWTAILAVSIAVAAAVAVKFSGLLLGPILIVILSIRVLSGRPWMIFGKTAQNQGGKLAAGAGVALATVLITWMLLWACYDFRFAAGQNGIEQDPSRNVDELRLMQLRNRLGRDPTPREFKKWRPPFSTRLVLFAHNHRLIPQAWADGFIYVQADQGQHASYFLGRVYTGRNWWYFPVAVLVKAPLATIAAVLIAVGVAAYHWKALKLAENRWTLVVLIVPPLVYATVAVASNLNIGIRHIFPIYPFVFVATGVCLSRLWKLPRWRIPLCFLGAMLIAETAFAFPDYLAFFNVACRSQRLYLLSDSNLDWGQDLPLLADWQKSHQDVPLYLDYFGSADPHEYGIKYVDVRHDAPAPPKGPGVVGVSATYLQLHEFNRAAFRKLGAKWRDPPADVLGGTIYLYAFPSH